jgi:phage gp29-like protein
LETQLWGISGVEFIPGKELCFETIPRKHIKPETGIISYEQTGNDGIPYTHLDNVWVMGDPKDLGLLLKCAPLCLYKRGGLADWAEYIEIFGQPVRIIRYDSYDEQTKSELKQVLEECGSSLSIMLPRQADFEIKDGKQSNSDGDLQLSFIKLLNEEMSIIILGNTDTTNSSSSSGYAQSKIHLQQQYEITRSDLAYTAAMLNDPHFLNILNSYGYPVSGGRFVYSKDMDIEYLTKRIAIDKAVAEQVNIPVSYWYDTYGIKEA